MKSFRLLALQVLSGVLAASLLQGCNDTAQSASGNEAQLTVSLPHASSNRTALKVAAPEYIKTYTIEVRDAAENVIVPSREISASGGEVSLSVPPNTTLHVIGAAFGEGDKEKGTARFRGDKVVPPIAVGAKASVALILEALTPLGLLVEATGQGPLTVAENVVDVAVIETNAKDDQHLKFSISGGADQIFFKIAATSGQLSFAVASLPTFANPQDTNKDNIYEVQVTFTDGFESVTQDLKVAVVQQRLMLFVGYEGGDGSSDRWNLWRTDGTPAGTFGLLPASARLRWRSDTQVVLFNGAYFFTASDPTNGTTLWTTDGTVEGTKILVDINGTGGLRDPTVSDLTVFNGALYFSAYTQDMAGAPFISRLWTSNGTSAGTKLVTVVPDYIWPTDFTVFKGELYFNAVPAASAATGAPKDFVKTDGATISVIQSSLSSRYGYAEYQGELYFGGEDSVNGAQLWKSDGTPGGTWAIWDVSSGLEATYGTLSEITVINDVLYFSADNGALGLEPWAFDPATMEVPILLTDIYPGLGHSSPRYFTAFNGFIYFSVYSGLWKSTGLATGTEAVLSSLPRSLPGPLTVFNGALYFQDGGYSNSSELWRYDGATAPQVVKKMCTVNCGTFVSGAPRVFNGEFYYHGNITVDGVSGVWLIKLGSSPGSTPQPLRIICSSYCDGVPM